MKYYTIWKSNINNSDDDALLIKAQPFFRIKRHALKRARKLAKQLVYDRGDTILVRQIYIKNGIVSEDVLEWEFRATPN